MADEQRITILEQHVRALYEQIGSLRAELRGQPAGTPVAAPMFESVAEPPRAAAPEPAGAQAPSAAPPPPREHSAPRPAPEIDLEKLVGRYGTIAVASLAILMGVGTFLSWAIEHGHLGPSVRVVLGFIGAAMIAGIGLWVREHRDVRFGNVLLALSLAVVHVDAWAAGPHLQVISTVAALIIAALASASLAALALTSEARTLFAIGFAGALAAPFVTAREPGSVVLLLTYGWVVIALSLFAIRERGWRSIMWLTLVGAACYVYAAAFMGAEQDHGWIANHSQVLFAFACAAAGLLFARDALRSKLALAFLFLACVATLFYSINAHTLEVSFSLVGTIASYLIARELETDERWLVMGNILVPLGFLLATVFSAPQRTVSAVAAVALTAIAAVLAWEDEEERPHHLFVTAVASAIAIGAYLVDFDTRCIGALALHAALFSVIFRSTRARLLIAPIFLTLLLASVWTFFLLDGRGSYDYRPFQTIPSLCALACVAAWAVFANSVRPLPNEKLPEQASVAALMSGAAILAAFVWGRQELVVAWSPDAALFALIIYYALAGLALIFAGRYRRVGFWRAVGLGLAFYAGYKALVQTFSMDAVSMRVGARILVGVFLAAVAYWYRVPSAPGPQPPGDADASSPTPAGAATASGAV